MSVLKTSFSFLSLQLLFNNAFFTSGGFGSCPPCCLPLGSHEVLCDDKIAVKTHSSFPARNTGVHATCFSEVFVRWGRELKVAVLISWWEIKTKKLGGWAVWHMEWGMGHWENPKHCKRGTELKLQTYGGEFLWRGLNHFSYRTRKHIHVQNPKCIISQAERATLGG